MTRKVSRVLVALLALAPALALAVPNTIGFSARVADNGRPVTGAHSFTFSFWDCDGSDPGTCTTPLWTETQTLTVNDGVVAAALGADPANLFGANVFSGAGRWFSVAMDSNAFGPFMAVNSVPYAMRADNATHATTADNFTFPPQTRYLMLAGGACIHPPTPTGLQVNNPFFCDLTDGTTNTTGIFPVTLPAGASILGFQARIWASGTVTCNLVNGVDGWSANPALASVSRTTQTNWNWTTEAPVTHTVSTDLSYAVICTATGVATDQGVGTVRIRYTVTTP